MVTKQTSRGKALFIMIFALFLTLSWTGAELIASSQSPAPQEKKEEKKEKKGKKGKKTEEEEFPEGTVIDNDTIKRINKSGETFNITTVKKKKTGKGKKAKKGSKKKGKKKKNKIRSYKVKSKASKKASKKRAAAKKTKVDPKTTEAYWRARRAKLVKNIKSSEKKIKQMEKRLAYVRGYITNAPTHTQFLAMKKELVTLRSAIENYKRGLKNLEAQLEDLAEEARKADVPPGWVRD